MLTFLFWNIKKRPIQEIVAEIVEAHEVDILLLAECEIESCDLLGELNDEAGEPFSHLANPSGRIETYIKFDPQWMSRIEDRDRLSFYDVTHPNFEQFLLIAAHLHSRQYRTPDDLNQIATRWRADIEEVEARVGHSRTLLVGDLNMNPYDIGVVSSEGLHGVMSRTIAQEGQRIVSGQSRRFFYNPMWSRLGDESIGPPGTYYYRTSTPVNYFWHTFDQVLLRPELLERFGDSDLQVITEVSSQALVNHMGRPDKLNASDHLPLLFKLNF